MVARGVVAPVERACVASVGVAGEVLSVHLAGRDDPAALEHRAVGVPAVVGGGARREGQVPGARVLHPVGEEVEGRAQRILDFPFRHQGAAGPASVGKDGVAVAIHRSVGGDDDRGDGRADPGSGADVLDGYLGREDPGPTAAVGRQTDGCEVGGLESHLVEALVEDGDDASFDAPVGRGAAQDAGATVAALDGAGRGIPRRVDVCLSVHGTPRWVRCGRVRSATVRCVLAALPPRRSMWGGARRKVIGDPSGERSDHRRRPGSSPPIAPPRSRSCAAAPARGLVASAPQSSWRSARHSLNVASARSRPSAGVAIGSG